METIETGAMEPINKANPQPTSLGQAARQVAELVSKVADNGGEIDEAIEVALELTEATLRERIDACGWVLERLPTEADIAKEAETYYANIRKAMVNAKARLRSYILDTMRQMHDPATGLHVTEIRGDEWTFSVGASPPALDIVSEEWIPADFFIYEKRVDKEKLKEHVLAGNEIPGVRITRGDTLRVKRTRRTNGGGRERIGKTSV